MTERRLALVTDRPGGLDRTDLAFDPDDDGNAPAVEWSDTDVTFPGWVSKLSFDRRSNLVLHFTVDRNAEVSNRDIIALRGRMLRVTLEPTSRGRNTTRAATDPTVDPVTARIHEQRAERLIEKWMEREDSPDDAELAAYVREELGDDDG